MLILPWVSQILKESLLFNNYSIITDFENLSIASLLSIQLHSTPVDMMLDNEMADALFLVIYEVEATETDPTSPTSISAHPTSVSPTIDHTLNKTSHSNR